VNPSAFDVAERTATLITLVLLFGAAVFRARVATPFRAHAEHRDDYGTFPTEFEALVMRAGAVAGAMLVVLAGVRLHAHVIALFDTWSAVGAAELRALLLQSAWGRAWVVQVVAAAVVASGPFLGRAFDGAMAIPIAIAAAFSGHAAAAGALAPVSITADAVHLIAAGAWIGGLVFVVLAMVLGAAPASLYRIVRSFSPIALACAATVVLTGIVNSVIHVGSFGALLSSAYGNQLVAKLFFVAGTAAAGAWNWKQGTPALALGNIKAIRRGIAVEIVLAIAVLLVTARLVVLEPPSMGP
jgi:putative copper export protein